MCNHGNALRDNHRDATSHWKSVCRRYKKQEVSYHATVVQSKGTSSPRMEGKGEYIFPTGTKYVGDMKDGM